MQVKIVLRDEAGGLAENGPERAFRNRVVIGDEERLRSRNRHAPHFHMRAFLADGGKAEFRENRNQIAARKVLKPHPHRQLLEARNW